MLENNESEVSSSCYVCHQTESADEKGQLKKLSESTWATVKRIAAFHKSLKSDKYSEVTQTISVSSVRETSDLSYHLYCYKSYTAVKRVKDNHLMMNQQQKLLVQRHDVPVLFPSPTSKAC